MQNDVFSVQRRSSTSNCNSNTTLLGTTPIPPEVGTTVTGALANIYNEIGGGTDWIFVLGNSFASSSAVAYKIRNGFVAVFIKHSNSAAGWTKIANLPSEVRPPHRVGAGGYNSGSGYYIDANGDVYGYMLNGAVCQTYPKE